MAYTPPYAAPAGMQWVNGPTGPHIAPIQNTSVPMTVSQPSTPGLGAPMTVAQGVAALGGPRTSGGRPASNSPPPTNPAAYASWFQRTYGMSPQAYASQNGLFYTSNSNPWEANLPKAAHVAGVKSNVFTVGQDPSHLILSNAGMGEQQRLAALKEYERLTGHPASADELGYQFAGVNQWQANLQGTGGDNLPQSQRNVSMQGFSDLPSLQRLLGTLSQYRDAGRTGDFNKLLAERNAAVPDWAPQAQKDVEQLGLPYLPVEYIASPEINANDPTKPFFGSGESPVSLFQATGFQQGEDAFYRSLDSPEFFKSIAPLLWAQYHRQAGSAAPFESGITFGSPVLQQNGTFEKSPVMGASGGAQTLNPEAMRIAGFTPNDLANAPYGEDQYKLLRSLGGGLYNRFTGWGSPGAEGGGTQPPAPGTMPQPPSVTDAVQQLDAWWYKTYGAKPDQNDAHYKAEKQRVEAEAQALNDKFSWWQNPIYGPYGNLSPEDAARFDALRGDPTQQYFG